MFDAPNAVTVEIEPALCKKRLTARAIDLYTTCSDVIIATTFRTDKELMQRSKLTNIQKEEQISKV